MLPTIIEEVYKKTNGFCGFPDCNTTGKDNLEIHHIYSKGTGGNDSAYNLILLCKAHHRAGKKAVHLCAESMRLIQGLYAPDKEKCMKHREEFITSKKARKSINKALSEKRKANYQKLKDSKPKISKDKNIASFRENLRLKKSR